MKPRTLIVLGITAVVAVVAAFILRKKLQNFELLASVRRVLAKRVNLEE